MASSTLRGLQQVEVWSAADSMEGIKQPLLADGGVKYSNDVEQQQIRATNEAALFSGANGGYGGSKDADEAAKSLEKWVSIAIYLSLAANVILLAAKLFIYVITRSNSIAASLADSVVDILSQGVIALAEYQMKYKDPRFPIGKTRLETIGVIVSAGIMSVCSIEVIQSSWQVLWEGLVDKHPTYIHLDYISYGVLGFATATKICLYIFCSTMKEKSGAALALSEDHLNDTLSNCMAMLTAGVASNFKRVWWIDSAGGALISLYIIGRWVAVAKDHVDKLVGKGADEGFVEAVKAMAHNHHKMLLLDEIRAYFFGQKYFVELEAVLPSNMSVQESHDIGVALQHKIEALEEVERAFVHIDYQTRDTPEHKMERELSTANH